MPDESNRSNQLLAAIPVQFGQWKLGTYFIRNQQLKNKGLSLRVRDSTAKKSFKLKMYFCHLKSSGTK